MLELAAALLAAYAAMKLLQFLFRRHRAHQTFKRMGIPGPRPNFIHGQLYETRRQAYVRFAHKMHEKFGKNVGIYLGGDPFLLTKDLELIQQVFVAKSRLFYDRMNFYLNVDPVPDNLICQRGERWRYMRKLLTPAFSNAKIKSSQFYLDAHRTVCKLMKQLDANSARQQAAEQQQHQTVTVVEDVYDRMAAVALDVIVKTAFHMDDVISFDGPLGGPPTKGKPVQPASSLGGRDAFLQTAKRACRLGFNPLVELIFCFPFLDRPLTFLCNHIYFGSIIRLLFDRLDYLVTQKRPPVEDEQVRPEASNEQQQQQQVSKRRRIIDSLIEVLRERKITKSEFTGNAFVIVFAGFETTANALTFTMWLLAKHQRVQEKLRHELRRKMADIRAQSGDSSAATARLELELVELATGCDYLEMVINESLRLYPPVPGLACRQASTTCTLAHNGLIIERGVNVIPSVFSIHRDKSIWGERANEFLPERFEMLDVSQLNSAMFMPFGLGPRNCIGKAAAMHELKIVVGRLVLNYSIEACTRLTPERLKLCSPINITITNAERIGLKFVKI
jgi:cytochrome P450